ncbi:MAG TPA: diacylglycerol kinase family protein [Anaerolineales bacterium]
MRNRGSLVSSFRNALTGLNELLRTQRNARIHLAITLAVIGLAAWLRLSAADWALLAVTAALVWTAELINTALEAVVDLASPGRQPLARLAKDLSAAAVLVAAVGAAVVGALVLAPPLFRRVYWSP